MDLYLFIILFVLGLVLIFITFFKKHIITGVFTGITFIILGLMLWNGLSMVSGYNEYVKAPCNDNCTEVREGGVVDLYSVTSTNVTYVFSEVDNYFGDSVVSYTDVSGVFFILFGLFMLIVSSVMVFSGKTTFDFGNEGQEE